MNKVTIIIENMEGAAFEDNGKVNEVAAILRRTADRMERDNGMIGRKLFDENGNAVGTIDIEEGEPGEE